MAGSEPEKGDKVSWSWGGGAPGGTVAETKHDGEIAIKSKRGNTIKKNASPDNPAVHVERSGNDVVKRASELTIEQKNSSNGKQQESSEKDHGEKRKAGSQEVDEDEEDGGSDEDRKNDDTKDPHTKNKEGKEVKKGGKQVNKKQKKQQENADEDNAMKDENGAEKKHEDDDGDEDVYKDDEEEEASEEDEEVKDDDDGEAASEDSAVDTGNPTKSKRSGAQKVRHDSKDAANHEDTNAKTPLKTRKESAPREQGDLVSTRTRSQDKS